MYLLGIDLGTSFIKISVLEADTGKIINQVQIPEQEMSIISLKPGWAEQEPEIWWDLVQKGILQSNSSGKYDPQEIKAIGIAYQMHGLVLMDKKGEVLRPSIIWCDSRAVQIGEEAFQSLGNPFCLETLLNSPGNFTASKLAWVKNHEPEIYARIDRCMLPGDYIAYKLTGKVTTTPSALSEGIFWDFKTQGLSRDILRYFDFRADIFPEIQSVFSEHGKLEAGTARKLGLNPDITVSYKAGDQLNNALSLGVLEPGQVAATAGTSGVIYQVIDHIVYDPQSRINPFCHINHSMENTRLGVLLCINGAGIAYQWIRKMISPGLSYSEMNLEAEKIEPGSEGLIFLPFGNGAERILENRIPGCSILNFDFNIHTRAHIYRAGLEGIAMAFRYGLDIMRENGLVPKSIRAHYSNLFYSPVFQKSFVEFSGVPLKLFSGEGGIGAAIGAGIGIGFYKNPDEAFHNQKPFLEINPENNPRYEKLYQAWKLNLNHSIKFQ